MPMHGRFSHGLAAMKKRKHPGMRKPGASASTTKATPKTGFRPMGQYLAGVQRRKAGGS